MKGPQVMKGYLKNEVATKDCMHDGWFSSGMRFCRVYFTVGSLRSVRIEYSDD